MSHHGRSDWRFFIFLCVLLIMAAVGLSYKSLRGQVSEDRRVAPLVRISAEEAVEACRPWAAKLRIEEPLQCLEVRENSGEAFNLDYIVGTADRTHEFIVHGYRGSVGHYENKKLRQQIAERDEAGQQAAALEAAQLHSIELRFAQELFDFFDWQHTELIDGSWRELCTPTVSSGNIFTIRLDPQTGGLVVSGWYYREVEISVSPKLSIEQCWEAALRTARSWPRVKDAWIKEEAIERHEALGYYCAGDDSAGVQRLMCLVPVIASQVPKKKYDSLDSMQQKSATQFVFLFVDARNGECINPDRIPQSPHHTVNEELVPFVNIGEKQFGMIGPLYPPRIRSGAPYIYVGYLHSLLWRGRVQVEGQAAQIQYAGRTWQVVADSKTARVDGEAREFEQPALMIKGYLYLPPQMINAITGWHVAYVAQEKTVYIYSHLKGEQQEQTDN